jgi:hypothetical protein
MFAALNRLTPPSDPKEHAVKLFSTPILASALLLTACSNEPQPTIDASESPVVAEQPNVTPQPTSRPAADPSGAPSSISGAVLETMNSGGYTYVLVDTGDASVWAAGPVTTVEVGDVISATGVIAMPGFHSNTLERDFDMIYFATAISGTAVGEVNGGRVLPTPETTDSAISVARAEGGQTVEELFTQKDKLVGQEVLIHAQVVKFSADIMQKNWMHIRDGSGSEGTNDMTITTAATAAIGDVVTVRGTLVADKDFGFGYKYALIIEDAEVTAD